MKKSFLFLLLMVFGFCAPAGAAGQLVIFMWPDYLDPEVVSEFERDNDVKVKFNYYESNEEMAAKLQSGGVGQYDLVMPSTYLLPSLKNLGLIQPLDQALLPNLENISQDFREMDVDPGNAYSVPYMWGISGMAVGSLPEGESVDATWGLIYDPAKRIGNFAILDNARDALGGALKSLGYSLNSTDPAQIEEAARLLIEAKQSPNFLGFYGGVGSLEKILDGSAKVVQAYNSDSGRMAMESPGKINFILPQEGGEIWADLLAIPAKAPNAEMAHKFINYTLEAEVAARIAAYNQSATPIEAAKAFIPAEDLNNTMMYPSGGVMKKVEYIKDLGPVNRIYDEAWSMIKAR
ncbi:polyamine ABC transporter substrate-binding protein [Deltaproteobacteria bacterium Smac51]|nr:polyamine ABC transporter substrate-binding protein [Deltaproteobacteria bacterium Smac51]